MGEITGIGPLLRFYDFFVTFPWLLGYTVFFLGHATRSNPSMDFHGLWLDVFSPKDGPFAGYDNIGIHWG